jgi:single-strand DNA-binding protein
MSVSNNVTLIGRLTKDVELKFLPGNGTAVANFTLAVDRNFTKEDGTREADFIPIVCWRKTAETAANYLHKGSLIAISGSIQVRKYQAQDGSNRYSTEVIADEFKFLEKKDGTSNNANNTKPNNQSNDYTPVDDNSDEIPF